MYIALLYGNNAWELEGLSCRLFAQGELSLGPLLATFREFGFSGLLSVYAVKLLKAQVHKMFQ